MKIKTRINFICVLFIATFVLFLPNSANAYQVNLTSFQSGYSSTGEIYGYLNGNVAETTFFGCLEKLVNVNVPGQYNAQDLTLTGNSLRAAWLFDNYAYSIKGAYAGYDALQTGVAVQNAMWVELGYTIDPIGSDLQTLVNTMRSAIPSIDLSYLQSKYVYVDLYSTSGVPVQDLIRPVPIPAAFWLLGSGLLGLVGIRRRFKR